MITQATILEEVSPRTQVMIAEPAGFDEMWASIKAGRRLTADIAQKTICDALATPTPGIITFPILQRLVKDGFTLTDDEVAETMVWAFKYLKLVIEPGGAVALAAVYHRKINVEGRTIGLTLSGGNVDPSLYATFLRRFG